MTEKRFWCLEEYEGETSPIVDKKYAPTNGWLCNKLNELNDENIELHIQLDFLKDENKHMKSVLKKNRELEERNNRQYERLGQLYDLIEKQDWESLTGIIQELEEAEEQLQKEWGAYGDVE